jgi:hypothetical protein
VCHRPGRRRRIDRDRLAAGKHAVPEALLSLEQFKLIKPVAGDLEDLKLVVAEDDREDRPLDAGDRHIVLELGHVALEHLIGLRKGAGVLRFPNGAAVLNQPIERAPPPVMAGARDGRGNIGDSLAG